MKTNYYFAYGSNTKLEHLLDRSKSGNHQIDETHIKKLSNACLPDRRLGFTRRSDGWHGGVLDVVPCTGSVVEGVIFEVSAEAKMLLDEKEGVKSGCYRQIAVNAILPDGTFQDVFTYEVVPENRKPFIAPSEDYLSVIKAGYEEYGICPDALLNAAEGSTEGSRVDSIFVYGTLMRGECRHRHMINCGLECVILAEAPGSLWNLISFPLMKVGKSEKGWVKGEFVRYKTGCCPLRDLDLIEGIDAGTGKSSGIKRSLLDVGTCDGRIRTAWIYVMEGCAKERISSGDWRQHRGTRKSFIDDLVQVHTKGMDEKRLRSRLTQLNSDVGSMKLEDAIAENKLSERRLAQISGNWMALVGVGGDRFH